MGKLLNILPVSDLRQDAAKILKKLRSNKEPIIITQRGRAAAVIIGVEAYEKSEHEKEILRLFNYKIKDDVVWIGAVRNGAQLPKQPRR